MRNILILIILVSGLIFTSWIKNKTRLLEKELIYLDNEINILSSNLSEASLDFYYLSTPKHISLLAKNFIDENFIYYKESQIKKLVKPEKDLAVLKKLKNDIIFSQLSAGESIKKKSKSNAPKRLDNTQLLIAKKVDIRQARKSKEIIVSKKVQKWMGIQIIKTFFGIPTAIVK